MAQAMHDVEACILEVSGIRVDKDPKICARGKERIASHHVEGEVLLAEFSPQQHNFVLYYDFRYIGIRSGIKCCNLAHL